MIEPRAPLWAGRQWQRCLDGTDLIAVFGPEVMDNACKYEDFYFAILDESHEDVGMAWASWWQNRHSVVYGLSLFVERRGRWRGITEVAGEIRSHFFLNYPAVNVVLSMVYSTNKVCLDLVHALNEVHRRSTEVVVPGVAGPGVDLHIFSTTRAQWTNEA